MLVIMPGFGKPLLEEKFDSLLHNIKSIPKDSDYIIFQYSDIPEHLLATLPSNVKLVRNSEGFAHRFLSLYKEDYVNKNGYSHVLLLLDDIKLHSWIPDETIQPTEYEIFSPTVSEYIMTPWKYMIHSKNDLPNQVFTSDFLELFAFYMTSKTFMHYCTFLSKKNPWGWGVDLIKREHMHLHPVLFNDWKMDHWKLGTSTPVYTTEDPTNDYLMSYGTTFDECVKREFYRENYDLLDMEMRNKPAGKLNYFEIGITKYPNKKARSRNLAKTLVISCFVPLAGTILLGGLYFFFKGKKAE
jgi:hypothetical protein